MFNIKVRLMQLGKKQVDLILALEKVGIKTTPPELSNSLSGNLKIPKADKILSVCNEIVSEWEKEAGMNTDCNR